MFVCVYFLFVLSCVQVALRRADHSSKKSYHLYKKDYETEGEARAQQRAVEPLVNERMKFWHIYVLTSRHVTNNVLPEHPSLTILICLPLNLSHAFVHVRLAPTATTIIKAIFLWNSIVWTSSDHKHRIINRSACVFKKTFWCVKEDSYY
jgi:hypothetical protein